MTHPAVKPPPPNWMHEIDRRKRIREIAITLYAEALHGGLGWTSDYAIQEATYLVDVEIPPAVKP